MNALCLLLVLVTAFLGRARCLSPDATGSASGSTKPLQQVYSVGTGIGDVTGPAAEVNLMGYAMMEQTARGGRRRRARQLAACATAMQQQPRAQPLILSVTCTYRMQASTTGSGRARFCLPTARMAAAAALAAASVCCWWSWTWR